MADVAAAATSGELLSKLVAAYGIQGALALLPLFAPGTSGAQKGFGAAKLAGTGASLAGINPKIPGTNIPAFQGALAGAGLGYNISQIVGNENLDTGQKAGHSAHAATDLGLSLAPVFGQFYAAAKLASALGQHLQGSGSPQVRGLGRSVDYAAEPAGAKGFWSVAQGDQSPKEAFKSQGGMEGLTLDLMGPVGLVLRGLGVHLPGLENTQTQGVKYRNQLQQIMGRFTPLKGLDMEQYNIDPEKYSALSPEAKQAGLMLGTLLMGDSPEAAKDRDAYGIQAQNIILNKYGNQTPDILKQILTPPTQTMTAPVAGAAPLAAPPGTFGWTDQIKQAMAAQPMAQRTQFQSGIPNNSAKSGTSNSLQGIMALLNR